MDHSIFKRLEGNRSVEEHRIKKIVDSIKRVGYILSPITVNECMEVIDGQGRVEALRRLGLPVYYVIAPGAGIEECVAMNMYQTNWTLLDYIKSHAETGNVPYVNLLCLINEFGKYFKTKVILYVATGKVEQSGSDIKEGRIKCDSDDLARAKKVLTWLTNFVEPLKRIRGHIEYYYMALVFCYGDQEVDNDRLVEKMTQLQANLIPVTQIQQAFDQIEEVYNNRSRNKVYIKTNYRKYMEGKYAWYEGKYGDIYEGEED